MQREYGMHISGLPLLHLVIFYFYVNMQNEEIVENASRWWFGQLQIGALLFAHTSTSLYT